MGLYLNNKGFFMKKENIIELKITLLDTKPKVYRTIQIGNQVRFFDLHVAIQIAFGWQNSHLHEFRVGEELIANPINDEFGDMNIIDENAIKLTQKIVFEKMKFVYIYDFGDDWMHEIEVVKFIEPKSSFYPRCIKASNNTPPEDIGGAYGFEEFKEIMGNRKHSEFKTMKKWYGGMYDEEYASLEEINGDFKAFEFIKQEMSEDE